MPVDELPVAPAFEAVEAWAGAGRVVRAAWADVAAWRLPGPQKAALISCGIPLIEGLVDGVSWHADPAMYQLAHASDQEGLLERITALDPEAYGTVGDHETHYWPAVLDRWLY